MPPYLVHGLTRSYFTRKVTGYLDYTDRPWRLEPCPPNLHPAATDAGWTGGIPVVTAPDGVTRMYQDHPDVRIVAASHDRELNDHFYIVPGLGDMGDRLFGTL